MESTGKEPGRLRSIVRVVGWIVIWVFIVIAAFLLAATGFREYMFPGNTIDDILFYLNQDFNGAPIGELLRGVAVVIPLMIVLIILVGAPVFFARRFGSRWRRIRNKSLEVQPGRPSLWWRIGYTTVVFLAAFAIAAQSFGLRGYVRSILEPGTFFEQNYVDPRGVDLVFPETPRNLIRIYLESVETTVASEKAGGYAPESRIPELEIMALDPANQSFSDKYPKIGGFNQVKGTGWSLAGMVSTNGGVPILSSGLEKRTRSTKNGKISNFLPGAYMIGDVLKEQGYNQMFIEAPNTDFGGMRELLTGHGGYKVLDVTSAKEEGRLPQDYWAHDGFEDKKLFQFAREEADRLSKEGKPFNLQIFTADTHGYKGYVDASCKQDYPDQMSNAMRCSSGMTQAFVKWVQDQPWAKDTVIVITGDHLGKSGWFKEGFLKDVKQDRTVYNVIVNSAVQPTERRARKSTAMDYYPTTLAAMGIKIPGDRLGLGVNLFSNTPTLLEQVGSVDAMNVELTKRSNFYYSKLLKG